MIRRVVLGLALASAVALVASLVGLVTGEVSVQPHWPGWLELLRIRPWQSLVVLGVITAGLSALTRLMPGREDSKDVAPTGLRLPDVADRVAVAVYRQWSYEGRWRQLDDPYAVSVRWEAADPALVASWPMLVKLATTGSGWPAPASWAPNPARLAGADNDLVRVLGRVPTGRLVVLGGPGAGKTILLVRLVLDLLKVRSSGEPVPIMLSLASWNPAHEDLQSWVERWLIRENPAFAISSPDRPNVSRGRALLEAGLILPILDGLDEMPVDLRARAIVRINEAMQPGQRLVLSARTDAFWTAVRTSGGANVQLAGAAGIELLPVETDLILEYLKDSAGGPEASGRWDPIVSAFAADQRIPVAEALTTPLMAALARAIYNPRPGEAPDHITTMPIELLDRARFPTRIKVEQYLFDAFVPAAYRPHPDPSRQCKWSADQALRWHTWMADDLQSRQGGTTDFAWWRLAGAASRPLAGITVGLLAGLAGAFGLPGSIFKGSGLGLIATALVGLFVRQRSRFGRPGVVSGVAGGIIGGQSAVLISLYMFGQGVGNTRLASLVGGGLAFGVAVAPFGNFLAGVAGAFSGEIVMSFYENSSIFLGTRAAVGDTAYLINGLGLGLLAGIIVGFLKRRTPAPGMHWSWPGSAFGAGVGLGIGAAVGLQAGITYGTVVGLVAAISCGLAGGLYGRAKLTDLTQAVSPLEVLARDRATFLASLSLGIPIGLSIMLATAYSSNPVNGTHFGWSVGFGVGLAYLVAVGLVFGFFQACWGDYALARFWLAASGRLPWRLMSFATDAHMSRGVLRQAGAVYQFRHADLQRRLAMESVSSVSPAQQPVEAAPRDDETSPSAKKIEDSAAFGPEAASDSG